MANGVPARFGVIAAQAGIQRPMAMSVHWIPACAEMTPGEGFP